jgi:hypothetical protein
MIETQVPIFKSFKAGHLFHFVKNQSKRVVSNQNRCEAARTGRRFITLMFHQSGFSRAPRHLQKC